MASKADLHDDGIGSPDGAGEVEDGEREDDSSDSGDGEVNSHSENENTEVHGGAGGQPIDDESEESTEEFVGSEQKSSSSASNMSNDHMISADDIDSDEEHIEKVSSSAHPAKRSPVSCADAGVVSGTSARGEESSGASTATSVDTVRALSKDGVRKPIRIEYGDDLSGSSEAVIRSPSLERETDVTSPPPSKLTSTSKKSKDFVNPESPASVMDVSEAQNSVSEPTACAVSPNPPTSFVGPESAINSPSVGFESLSPQSLGEDEEYPQANRPDGDHGNNVDALESSNVCQAPVKSLPNQSLEDQEGELDFEEETPEERREVAAEVASKHRKITMSSTENTSSSKKVLLKVDKTEDKEEGEEGEDGEDDGEVEDDDDLEEGEVKESTSIRKVQPKPICRFYSKGQCTWGSACRFLHPGINDKGNYNMFAPAKSLVSNNNVAPTSSPYIWPARPPAVSPTFGTRGYVEPLPLPLPPPPPPPPAHFDEPVRESAWERGLRHAKEILRKSTKRKETEPDFEEKRMNLGVSSSEPVEYEKENDYYNRSSPYPHIATATDSYSAAYSYDDVALDPFERQAHDYWRGGNYENFEVRYTRSDYQYRLDRSRLKDRELDHRDARNRERDLYREPPSQSGDRGRIAEDRSRREKFESRVVQHSPERSRRDDRYTEHSSAPRSSRGERGDEWCDPWRRSTSPKRHKLSRSFSSRSSVSYSSSGHSSGSRSSSYSSHSRSSSGSSNSSFSSRSYSPTQAVHQHHPHHQRHQSHHPVQHAKPVPRERSSTKFPPAAVDNMAGEVHRRPKPLPPGGHIPPQTSSGTRPPVDKRPTTQKQASAVAAQPQPSCDRKRPLKLPVAAPAKSSRSGSSHSRSSSGSSLVSVSSKSSASSKSSFNSGRNMSTLDALKREEKRVRERERMRTADAPRRPPAISSGNAPDRERMSNVRAPRDVRGGESQADLRMKSLVNASRTSKDPLRQAGQKPQIKLTLLNKAQPAEKTIAAPPPVKKQVADVRKQKAALVVPDKETLNRPVKVAGSTMMSNSRKRPLPTSPSGGALDTPSSMAKVLSSAASRNAMATGSKQAQISAAAAALLNKKSTSSRREELLKQLKAVEDAIARKRAKFTGPSSRALDEC